MGKIENGVWYVVDVLDPGPNSIFTPTYFEYDTAYVNHLANKVARLWNVRLDLLGLWHRHPGSFDSFSSTDDGTNREYASLRPEGAISGLVNIDPRFRITMYHVGSPLTYRKVKVEVGDDQIPPRLLQLRSVQDVIEAYEDEVPKKPQFFDKAIELINGMLPTGRPTSEPTLSAQPTDDAAVSSEPSAETEAVFDMLEIEHRYLKVQTKYDATIQLVDGSGWITLTNKDVPADSPSALRFQLHIENGTRVCTVFGASYKWAPNFVRSYLSQQASP